MTSVFISHSSRDRGFVEEKLVPLLQNYGIKTWFSEADIQPSEVWEQKLRQELKRTDWVIVVLSPNAAQSEWVRAEVHFAFEEKADRVIPVLYQDCKPADVHLKLGPLQYVEFRVDLPDASRRLLDAFGRECSSGGGPAPSLPTPPPRAPRHGTPSLHRRIAVAATALFGLALMGGLAAWHTLKVRNDVTHNMQGFVSAAPWLNWLVYDPTEYDPYKNLMPSDDSIRQDLDVLRRYGFNGLITITCRGTCGHIARIAKETGFNMVVVGVYDLRDPEEIRQALQAAPFADAYCLGNGGLGKLYSLSELKGLFCEFHRATRRPLTTTEKLADYDLNPTWLGWCDFLFPDIHSFWHDGTRPRHACEETLAMARRAAQIGVRENKPVLLKMISYPSGGADGLSPESQQEFYRLFLETSVSRSDVPGEVWFSYLVAFDPEWKTEEYGWKSPERFTGLFSHDRKPKPAVTAVNWRKK